MNETPLKKQQTTLGAFFKWATIGFLGLFGMLLVFGAFMISRLMPLIEVNGQSGSTKFFGGSLEVHDHDGIKIEGAPKNADQAQDTAEVGTLSKINGSLKATLLSVEISGLSGKIEILADGKPSFDCEVRAGGPIAQDDFIRDQAGDNVLFTFDKTTRLSRCTLKVPAGALVKVKLENGDVVLNGLKNPVNVDLTNGRISFTPAKGARYDLKANAQNGVVIGEDKFLKGQNALPNGSPSEDFKEVFQATLKTSNGVVIIE